MSRTDQGKQESQSEAILPHAPRCLQQRVIVCPANTQQDENKKLDDTEKKARLIVNERLDSLISDIQDVMASKGTARNERLDIDLDDLYDPVTE